MKLEVVSDSSIAKLGDAIDVTGAVRAALIAAAAAEAANFPVLRAHGVNTAQAINVKFGNAPATGLVGGKVGTFWPDNASRGLPNHAAATLLLHPETGFPRALVAARTLNLRRTAAADALAVDALARPEASVLVLVGAGRQAVAEARLLASVRELREIRIVARSLASSERTAQLLAGLAARVSAFGSVQEAVLGADIVVTVTPSRDPVLDVAWLAPGTHVSAMGADAIGKRELVLRDDAALFADLPEQAFSIGELQHLDPERRPSIRALGDVLADRAPGRTARNQITIFDSSGLAAQDLFAAEAALAAARRAGLVQTLDF